MANRVKDGIRSWLRKHPYFLYIFPSIFIMAILVIFPTMFLYFISITNYEMGYPLSRVKIVWLNNFIRLFSGQDKVFWYSLYVSILFMLIVTAVELVLGYLAATLLNRSFKLKNLVFACLIVPIAITPSIAAQIWKLMLNAEYGIVNYILTALFNIKLVWLGPDLAFVSILLIDIWQWTPYMTLILYAGLRSIPSEPYESAVVEGASSFQVFANITVPLLKPLIIIALLFRSIDALRLFDIPYVLTQGGPGNATELLSLHVFRLGFAQTGWIGRASAASIVLMIIIIIISQQLIKFLRRERS